MAGSIDRLEAFMVSEHKLDPSVFQKVKDLGAQSVSDFFGLYTECDYEEGVKELLLAALAESSSVVCDLMSASSTAFAEEDLEAPFPTELRQKQEDAFLAKYSLKFPPEFRPSSSLLARHYREFRRMKKEVDDLQKVRSAAESSAMPVTEVKQLGDFRVILKAEPPAQRSAIPSLHPGTKVNEFAVSDVLTYRTFAAERLRRHPGSVNQAIQWFLDRDHQTRVAAGALYAEDYPFGEALRQFFLHKTAVLWQVGNVGLIDEPTRPKRSSTATVESRQDDAELPNPTRPRVPRTSSGQTDSSTGKTITSNDVSQAVLVPEEPFDNMLMKAASSFARCYDQLSKDSFQPATLAQEAFEFASRYVDLNKEAERLGMKLCKIKPKLRMFLELSYCCTCSPSANWCYRDEDFAGKVAMAAFRRGGANTVRALAESYFLRWKSMYAVPELC
ncbi:unnamed protein product [Symbiodinium sp. CCMP2592]|nr:unnamed protein product [Symbiodinium sp. CCMP2592]